jgi:regulator of sigma E protease
MSVIIFILILAVLIIVHEYGHFIVAKLWGIQVDEFGLGYPPRAKTLFKRKGTLFTLNWLPFGGFVKILGENPDDVKPEDKGKGKSLVEKSKFAQASVMFAGPLFNFIFAWVIVLASLFIGLPTAVEDDQSYIKDQKTVIVEVVKDSPADFSDIKVGDTVRGISFDGRTFLPIQSVNIKEELASKNPKKILLEISRNKETVIKDVQIAEYLSLGEKPTIGIGFQEVGIYNPPFGKSILKSFEITGVMIYQIANGLISLIVDALQGHADVSNLTGPVGIVALVGDASTLGVSYLLTFIALIYINLVVINLIPFPALDGGRILFLIIEKIKGSPISVKVANTINVVGFGALILLMLFITFKDIVRLI